MNGNWLRAKSAAPVGRGAACSKIKQVSHRSHRTDQGFTLVELLIVMLILPIIIGATTLSLVSVISLKSSVSDRLGASADAQVVAASFYSDVQSAAQFTTFATPSNPGPCGTTTQILGFEWGTPTPNTVVSYAVVPNGTPNAQGAIENSLIRYECTWASGTLTVTNTRTLSYNATISLPLTVAGKSCTSLLDAGIPACLAGTPWTANWTSATGITNISLTANEAATNSVSFDHNCLTSGTTYCYSVGAAPRNWEQINAGTGNPNPPPSGLVPTAQFLGASGVDLTSCTSGNPNIDINGELVIDSSSSPATSGKTNVYASSVYYVNSEGTPTNIAGGTVTPISQPAADPLAGLPAPDTTGLPTNPAKKTIGTVTYAYPGIYTTTLSGTLTLSTGVYVLQNGISGNITSGVGGNLLYVTGGAVLPAGMQIWPMTSGTYAGLALWQGPAVQPYDATGIVSGGNDVVQIGGIVYAPGAVVTFTKGTASWWVGALLTAGLSCSGGGIGELNIGYYQSISFTAPGTGSAGSHYNASATGGASGNPVVFSIDNLSGSGVCSASGTNGHTINFLKAGTCLVDANQAQSDQSVGQGGYLEAPTVQQSIQVG